MRTGLIILGALFLSGFLIQLFAQEAGSLSGIVRDAKTGKPISGVSVSVENTSISAITDSKSRFKINRISAGEYSLKFTVAGYEERKLGVTVSPAIETSVVVMMKPIASDAVQITGTPMTQTTETKIAEPKTQPKSTTPGEIKYERKSVSYANVVLSSDPNIIIDDKRASYIIKTFREYIEMPRFDYNPIPNELLREFEMEIKSRGRSITLNEVVEILKQKFVPKIIEILDIEKEMRAQNLVTEAQRNSFIATKAKTLGITAEQLMKVMNSAFIYIPVISSLKVEREKDVISVEITAGAIWYRVIYDESGASDLKFVVMKETRGKGIAKIGKQFKYKNEKISDQEYAFRTAIEALARDLQVATREIPEFRLGVQVAEVYSNHIAFPMGTKEGVKIDDGFDLVEVQENPQGEIKLVNVGFVRITNVADNRTNPSAFSRAQIIIGGRLEPGIYASERPKLPFDLVVKIANNPFTIKSDDGKINKMTGYSIGAELLYDLGKNANVPQLWIGAGIFFGGGSSGNLDIIKNINEFKGQEPSVSILEIRGSLLKKFYFRRLCAFGRVDLILEGTGFSRKEGDLEYRLSHSSLGLGVGIGSEYVATPDINLGFSVGYRIFSESEDWSSEFVSVPRGTGNHSGMVFSVYLNYSLPRLGFDPLAWMRGLW